ncbi:unnamed protein product, partial [marine sediment metagenome]
MKNLMQNPTVRATTISFFILLTVFEGFVKYDPYNNIVSAVLKCSVIIAAFTLILGVVNVA